MQGASPEVASAHQTLHKISPTALVQRWQQFCNQSQVRMHIMGGPMHTLIDLCVCIMCSLYEECVRTGWSETHTFSTAHESWK